MSSSLAEISSVWPSAGGVYLWSYYLSPPKYAVIASWVTGWINVVANLTLCEYFEEISSARLLRRRISSTDFPLSFRLRFSNLGLSINFGGAQLIMAAISIFRNNEWTPEPYQTVLCFFACMLFVTFVNVYGVRGNYLEVSDRSATKGHRSQLSNYGFDS